MKVLAKISLVLIAAFAMALCSCSMNIPDGQGLLVVETDSDNVYLKSIYAKRSGDSVWIRVWNERHGIDMTHGNIFLDAGKYKVYAITSFLGVIPIVHTTGFAEIEIHEGQTKFLYASGLFLSE